MVAATAAKGHASAAHPNWQAQPFVLVQTLIYGYSSLKILDSIGSRC
jgi:hypothetical protein